MVLSEDACACLATGELPPGVAGAPSPKPRLLTDEEHAELATQSQALAARLPKLNLGTPKRRSQRAGAHKADIQTEKSDALPELTCIQHEQHHCLKERL